MSTDQLTTFLKKNKDYLRINHIERTANIPQSTINRAMSGRSNLTPDQQRTIRNYLKSLYNGLEKLFSE